MTAETHNRRHLGPEALDRLLDGEERPRWSAHLDRCSRCREELAGLRTLVTALESIPTHEPSPGFTERVMARVQLPAARRARRGVLEWLRWAAVPAAGATAVTAAGGWFWILSRPEVSMQMLAGIAFDAVQRFLVAAAIEAGEFLMASGLGPAVRQVLNEMSAAGALGALGAFGLLGLAVTVLALTSLQRAGPTWQTTRRV